MTNNKRNKNGNVVTMILKSEGDEGRKCREIKRRGKKKAPRTAGLEEKFGDDILSHDLT